MTLNLDFKVDEMLSTYCVAQLTRDLFAIAKFLYLFIYFSFTVIIPRIRSLRNTRTTKGYYYMLIMVVVVVVVVMMMMMMMMIIMIMIMMAIYNLSIPVFIFISIRVGKIIINDTDQRYMIMIVSSEKTIRHMHRD